MITKELFGYMPCGCKVYSYTLDNGSITSASILNYGGIIKNLWVKDKNGEVADVVCGYDDIDSYLTANGYQGALIGRVGNRIGGGKFTLDGVEYQLVQNDNGKNTLHGGKYGFNAKIWDVEEIDGKEPKLVLTYVSPDGEENFPGTLTVKVTYTLTNTGALSIHYEATTDKPTIVNMTSHGYFNLAGYAAGVIDDHTLWLDCDKINSLDTELIPDGKLIDVEGTPYDFRETKVVGSVFGADHPMMQEFGGIDNNFVCIDYDGQIKLRAVVTEPKSGRKLSVFTDAPCVQVYTGNMIVLTDPAFKGGVPQYKHCAICLETQAMPDSINHEGFTNIVLRPGEKYDTTTVYAFEN
ncbi:MAG: galactose mutarotase [Clostridia bacterium]|nr:galactose mutarotase [Clostridia bacterium]